MHRAALVLLLLVACKPKRRPDLMPEPPPAVSDGGAQAIADAAGIWPQLASFPLTDAIRVVTLPTKSDVPRFDLGGPVISSDVAVVSSSQFGFAAIDWRRGALAWTKPAGTRVAPPVAKGASVILIGECIAAPDVPDTLLGCMRVVTHAGADESYTAIHGKKVGAFAGSPGTQDVWLEGERTVRWRRGDQAVAIDLMTGVATAASVTPPPVHVSYRGRAWDVERTDERIIARDAKHKVAWQTAHAYSALLGAVYLADLAPMIRVANIGSFGGRAELNLLDIDATGSLHGQAAFPVPAISMLAYAIDSVGNTAIAIRMDKSLERDFVVGYAANALLMYVYPLPQVPRIDPVGVAIAPDAVLVFHDGDTFTILPELSTPPTAPGAPKVPLQNPTP